MSLSNREKALLGLLLVLGSVFLFNRYLFQPVARYNQQLISENNNLSTKIQEIEVRGTRYQLIEADELKQRDDYQEMLELVPESPMIPNIIAYLENQAEENHVKLISIQYKENKIDSPASQPAGMGLQQASTVPVKFQITANGTHYDLLSFVLALENAPRIYVINSLKISLTAKERSFPGTALPGSNTGISAAEQGELQAVPESSSYDRGKSWLNLDFNAYYHRSHVNGDASS